MHEAKTTKEINFHNAVSDALTDSPKLCSSEIISTKAISIDINRCYGAEGNEIEPDCLEKCSSGNFSGQVRFEYKDGASCLKALSGTFNVTEYNPDDCMFYVEIKTINFN